MKKEETNHNESIEQITEKLSPLEIRIIPYLKEPIDKIEKKSGLDNVSVLRALKFLESKQVIKLKTTTKTIIDLGVNGVYYKKNNLPERKLLILLEEQNNLPLEEAKKLSKLSENEFKVSLGVLKNKAFVTLSDGKLSLNAKKEELIKKSFEEQLLDALPIEKENLSPEMNYAFDNLKKRKDIIEIKEKNDIKIELSQLGKEL